MRKIWNILSFHGKRVKQAFCFRQAEKGRGIGGLEQEKYLKTPNRGFYETEGSETLSSLILINKIREKRTSSIKRISPPRFSFSGKR
jgi:hypothetical protein